MFRIPRLVIACSCLTFAAALAATPTDNLEGVYETGPTDGMSWAYKLTLRADGSATLNEPHPLPDGDGKTIEMKGTWKADGQKISVTLPGKPARRYQFKVNPNLAWADFSNCKPRKGRSFGLELIKAEEEIGGSFKLSATYYGIWRNGDSKWDGRKCN